MPQYTIPEWKNIKFNQYKKFYDKLKPFENTDLYSEKLIQFVCSHFFNIPINDIRELPESTLEDITLYAKELIFASAETPLVKTFILTDPVNNQKIKMGFIPDLEDMSYGEYLDLVELCKDTWANIPEIMSILYRPVTEEKNGTYAITKYSKISDNVKLLMANSLTMDIVFGATSFFFRLWQDLQKTTMLYSLETLKDPKLISQLRETFQQSGQHINHLSSLQEVSQLISNTLNN